MFKSKVFILILIIQLKVALSIRSIDICFATEKHCKGSYDSKNNYVIKCENSCQGKYGEHCGTDRCAINKMVCEEHQNIIQTLSLFFKSIKYKAEKEKFVLFNHAIKKCPINHHVWQPSDICINGLNCFQRKEIPMRNDNVYSLKKIDCPCKGEHSYRCGRDYCAVNNKACESFSLGGVGLTKTEASSLGLKGCGNDFITVKKTFSLF